MHGNSNLEIHDKTHSIPTLYNSFKLLIGAISEDLFDMTILIIIYSQGLSTHDAPRYYGTMVPATS